MLVWCLHLCQFFFGSELAPLKNQFVFHWSWNRGRATPVYQHIISVPQQSTHHTEAHNNNKVGRVECLLIYMFIFSLFAIGIRPIIILTYTVPLLNSMSPQLQKLFLSTTAFIFRLQIMHTYLACQIPKSFWFTSCHYEPTVNWKGNAVLGKWLDELPIHCILSIPVTFFLNTIFQLKGETTCSAVV